MQLISRHSRAIFALGAAIATGLFLSVASHELEWPDTTTLVVAAAMVVLLGLFGTPLVLLPHGKARPATDEARTPVARASDGGPTDFAARRLAGLREEANTESSPAVYLVETELETRIDGMTRPTIDFSDLGGQLPAWDVNHASRARVRVLRSAVADAKADRNTEDQEDLVLAVGR